MSLTFPDVAPANLRRALAAVVSLLDPAEAAARWSARSCRRMPQKRADTTFFPRSGYGRARAICRRCPARPQCALLALDEDAAAEYPPAGMFGGLTPAERVEALNAELHQWRAGRVSVPHQDAAGEDASPQTQRNRPMGGSPGGFVPNNAGTTVAGAADVAGVDPERTRR